MQKIDLTKGKVTKVLLATAIPIMGSSLLQFTYNLVDMLFVGRLGSDAVASVGSSSFFVGLGYSINAIVVIGTGIKVAHSIGNSDEIKTKGYINSGLILNFIIGLIYSLLLVLLGKELISFLDLGNLRVERDGYIYLALSAPMLFFAFFNLLYTRILSSYGNNKIALKINAVGVLTNIILDPILIYTFGFGVKGAAIATLISNVLMFVLYNIKSNKMLYYDFKIKYSLQKIIEIIKLGFPMSFQRVLFTLVNISLAKIISNFGSDAIAAQKIGLQIESITFMVIGGLNGAISSFAGQNFGAKKYKRILDGYNSSLRIGLIYSLFMALIFIFIPGSLVSLFIKEDNTASIACGYLQIVGLSQLFSTIEMVSNGLFTGVGKPKIPAIISIIFTVLRIPMALIFIRIIGVNGIWLSIALSSVLKGITAYLLYIVTVRKEYTNAKYI
ncbi:MATE family efflux transporter [Clostridium paraputrificum]|uniref:MATE family efflux transporter n=1 Tax=Clostridium paraputrificum TaxID=29363 RepID=UPI0034A53525